MTQTDQSEQNEQSLVEAVTGDDAPLTLDDTPPDQVDPSATHPDTRQRILDAALDLFIEQGFDGTSLRQIAEKLGVTKAALYYYFESKDDILMALHMRLHEFGRDALMRMGNGEIALEQWGELLDEVIGQTLGQRKIFLMHERNQASLEKLHTNEAHDAEHEDMQSKLRHVLADTKIPLADRVKMAASVGVAHSKQLEFALGRGQHRCGEVARSAGGGRHQRFGGHVRLQVLGLGGHEVRTVERKNLFAALHVVPQRNASLLDTAGHARNDGRDAAIVEGHLAAGLEHSGQLDVGDLRHHQPVNVGAFELEQFCSTLTNQLRCKRRLFGDGFRAAGGFGNSCFVTAFDPTANVVPPGTTVSTFFGFEFPVSDTKVNPIFVGIPVPLSWDFHNSSGQPVTNLHLCQNPNGTGCTAPWIYLSLTALSSTTACQSVAAASSPLPSVFNSGLLNLGRGEYSFIWNTLTKIKGLSGCQVSVVGQFDNGLVVAPAVFQYH